MSAASAMVYLRPLEGCDHTAEPLVRFRLTYEGELRATQGEPREGQKVPMAEHKQNIRKAFHGQLKRLWETSKFLKEARVTKNELQVRPSQITGALGVGYTGVMPRQGKPLAEYIAAESPRLYDYRFVPLVREEFSLLCNLDILFLRRDHPLGVLNLAGDLDNRIKTLIDGLRIPKSGQELAGNEKPAEGEDPFFCLLEDDDLVTGLTVQADMLLDPPIKDDGGNARVKLVISVELKPDDVTMFNLGFA
jgi:hypothetical protein